MSPFEPYQLPDPPEDDPPFRPTQEVRFAVVMFGGVSLAIYMNGITQELKRMVEATAPAGPYDPDADDQSPLIGGPELDGTQAVYRAAGRMVRHGLPPRRLADVEADAAAPIATRFVVDILSGTSAGGINAVFLAKALANNQDVSGLEELWKSKADIDRLLNDGPLRDAHYPEGGHPASLLNSRWMYQQLYTALRDMEGTAPPRDARFHSPLVDELDLYVTATDLLGYWAPVKTSDRLIDERIHKVVFRFRYAPRGWDEPNDLHREFNGMLAFAARCTSSFPVAFEPMALTDVMRLRALSESDLSGDGWRRFFLPYLRAHEDDRNYAIRQFADGGYLQNKPFSHALRGIRFRRGWVPVDRKLLFLDPFPEERPVAPATDHPISFVENLVLAASSLPRYQAIREDLDAVNRRNRTLYRVGVLRSKLLGGDRPRPTWSVMSGATFCETDVDTLVEARGAPFASYFYLRLYDITDQLALLVTRLLGFADDSDAFRAIRHLVRAWRENHYASNPVPDRLDIKLETEFLFRFDLSYRERRAEFLLTFLDDEIAELRRRQETTDGEPADGRSLDEEIDLLGRMRRGVRAGLAVLNHTREELWSPWVEESGSRHSERQIELRTGVAKLRIGREDLRYIMAPVDEEECFRRAREVLERLGDTELNGAAYRIGEYLAEAFVGSRKLIDEALALDDVRPAGWSRHVEDCLGQFDYYDSLLYPTLASVDLGERDTVETYRIGPADAIHTRTAFQRVGDPKLAGTSLAAFGGFLRREWRENDIMWGRLDGAERLLHAVLPGDDTAVRADRRTLIERAHRAIIDETFVPQRQEEFLELLGVYLRKNARRLAEHAPGGDGGPPEFDDLLRWLQQWADRHRGQVVAMLLQNALDSAARIDLFRRAYRSPGPPPLERTLERARRATRIFGRMLQGMGDDRTVVGKAGRAIGRLGPMVGYLIELSVPGTRLGRWRTRLVGTMLAASVLLLLGGYAYWKDDVPAGWRWLAATLLLSAVLLSIEWLLLPRGRVGVRRWLIMVGLLLAAGVLGGLWWFGLLAAWWPAAVVAVLVLAIALGWAAAVRRRRRA